MDTHYGDGWPNPLVPSSDGRGGVAPECVKTLAMRDKWKAVRLNNLL